MISGFRDTIADAYASVSSGLWHSILTGLGAMVGVGTLVLTLGLTTTLRAQVSKQFDALAATEIRLEVDRLSEIPSDFEQRLRSRPGVERVGRLYQVSAENQRVRRLFADAGETFPIFAADLETLRIARPFVEGPGITDWISKRGEHAALIGAAVARALGYTSPPGLRPDLVFIGERPVAVAGALVDVARHPELLSAIIIPVNAAKSLGLLPSGTIEILVETKPGAAQVIARRAALALRPESPAAIRVIAPPDPKSLRRAVDADIVRLVLALAGIALLLGGIGIGSSMLVSVANRVSEIGLRRALGSSRGQVALLFLLESAAIGTLGGVTGAALGALGISGMSLLQNWQAVAEPWLPIVAPLFGTMVGFTAGGLPAFRASRIEPAEALRR